MILTIGEKSALILQAAKATHNNSLSRRELEKLLVKLIDLCEALEAKIDNNWRLTHG